MKNWHFYPAGNHRVACPHCDKGPKDRAAGLKINSDGSGVLHCFRCDMTQTIEGNRAVSKRNLSLRQNRSANPQKRTTLSDWGRKLWDQCLPISGIAEEYLIHRRCVIPPDGSHLRWNPKVQHPSGYVGPALVGLITNAISGKAISLHRTWIQGNGKASVNPVRMQLANHDLKNGVIRLWPDRSGTNRLGIAEGIETALSLAHGYEPVWSVLDAHHMATLPALEGITELMIAQDNDQAGRSAARKCASRWFSNQCRVFITSQSANDLNDLLKEAA